MRYFVILFFSLFILSHSVFAQDNLKKHTVSKGETVTDIAKKYKITPYDIYRLNPDSQKGLKVDTVLLIPAQSKPAPTGTTPPVKEKTTKVVNTIHTVAAKETLYSIAKKYKVTVEDITKANSDAVKNGLQPGQKLVIPIKGNAVAAQVKKIEKEEIKKDAPSYLFHTVVAGDTKYSIAKQYGMTLQLLEELNPEVKETLPLNFKLKLDKSAIIKKETQPITPAVPDVIVTTTPAVIAPEYMLYKVQPKETFYNLTKKTGLTEDAIIKLNPEAKDGLRDGMELKLPKALQTANGDISVSYGAPGASPTDLTKTIKKGSPKEIALLLPFNMARIESDTTRAQLLRTDKFLNMTLDFYAGALMAIDSAKVLGLPLKVRILDSKENRNSSDVEALKAGLLSANAVVGPFFQNNVEKTAEMLGAGIPVISPLSKEPGKPYANLYQSMPSADRVKSAMLDYLMAKGGNVIAVVDVKKAGTRQFIKTNYPGVKFIEGAVTDASVRALLVKDKMNFVIMETENRNMIINTTSVLTKLLPDYLLQLAVLDKNESLDHDDIGLDLLTGLKMLYPSVTKDNETPEAAIFSRKFKQKNGIFPNQFATRGFDVTFDIILRLFQEEQFKDIMQGKSSEHVENKFSYSQLNGGNYNTGVYIMYYDQDLSVKEAQ